MTHVATAFDSPTPATVGVEEELMLLDPATLALVPLASETLARAPDDGRFKLEMPASQLEIVSPPLSGAGEAAAFLAAARADLATATRDIARLACAGVHPFAAAEGELNAGERYRWALERYGRVARRQLVFGLQVHVAVRGADRALAVYNALRSYLPEILALSANSPFYAGEDSGLASVRPLIAGLLPRQGVPPSLESWDAFAQALRWGERAGAVPGARFWWWELRPHPDFGTLEVRVADAQTTIGDACALIAIVHCLCAWLSARHDAGEPLPVAATWRIAENRWRALRDGLDGTLADLDSGAVRPTRDRLHELLDTLAPTARTLGCEHQLEQAHLLAEQNGAIRQRIEARRGVGSLVEWLCERYLDPVPGN